MTPEQIRGGEKLTKLLETLHIDYPQSKEDWELVMDVLSDLPQVDPEEECDLEFSADIPEDGTMDVINVRKFVAENDFRRRIQDGDVTGLSAKPAMQRRRVEIFVFHTTNHGIIILSPNNIPEDIHRSDYPDLPLGQISDYVDYAEISGAQVLTVRKHGSSVPYKRPEEIEPGIDLNFKIPKNGS